MSWRVYGVGERVNLGLCGGDDIWTEGGFCTVLTEEEETAEAAVGVGVVLVLV
jgi:hypothetical protein